MSDIDGDQAKVISYRSVANTYVKAKKTMPMGAPDFNSSADSREGYRNFGSSWKPALIGPNNGIRGAVDG